MELNASILSTTWSTRILVTHHGDDLLKARLSPTPKHPRALTSLLEGLALWTACPVHAALVAEGPLGASRVDALFGEGFLPEDLSNVRFDIVTPRKRKRLAGPGDFRQLRLLHGRLR
ncbi:MAG: hypothetical protein GY913_29830 [Proteobacteria bacterium]|nr:hypothetical protein [Pseudomonadota bacterium]